MKPITLLQPSRVVFGAHQWDNLSDDPLLSQADSLLFVVAQPLRDLMNPLVDRLTAAGHAVKVLIYDHPGEPTVSYFQGLLAETTAFNPGAVVGVGGGSVLDVAKLLAALDPTRQPLETVFGKDLLVTRQRSLICVPTTAGTGSEVSPNAILLDEASEEKRGVISHYLVPDVCYIDPELTVSLPPRLTAETGMDALCHCVEALTNVNAHPLVDAYALEGLRLIMGNLETACQDGRNLDARSAMALGAYYGGLCLGPVNTTAVHALSYGLSGTFHVPHGLANAILLPAVLRFNLPLAAEKLALLANTLGLKPKTPVGDGAEMTTHEVALAEAAIAAIERLSLVCGIPQRLSELGIEEKDIPRLVDSALTVKRLLVNNVREVTGEAALALYKTLL
ncbi:MAG: iron-containing alcohol dehydrogenase [Bacteroidales bacterium]|jgi:alcohol dehydrogenase|nr:iron-containing alcohol dehydrogenase [Bacteroidales bacterium]